MSPLADWYLRHGRHELPWRASRDRWIVLVSEVMLHQTQVPRVAAAWPYFIERFPTPDAMASAGPGAVISAWGRLGYPRRARRLWEASVVITDRGWPDDLETLPGVGRYTARAVAAQSDDSDVAAIEVNVRRVVERVAGHRLTTTEAEAEMLRIGGPLEGRDRLLALMDIGAVLCCAGPANLGAASARCGGVAAARARWSTDTRPAARLATKARSANAADVSSRPCALPTRTMPPSSTPKPSPHWSPTASPSSNAARPVCRSSVDAYLDHHNDGLDAHHAG